MSEKVTGLPDYDDFSGFDVFSGYVDLKNSSKKIHYLLVESARDPANDPLIIWYNGGPGCSSMLAFMQEIGPLTWPDGEMKMVKNEYAWNKEANVLFVEQPAGVGYSYCDAYKSVKECAFDDNNASLDNLEAVLGWFEKYPEFKENDLYLAGESYAGIYVPFLMNNMHHYIQQHIGDDSVFKPNLKGMMVGNGVTNWAQDTFPSYFEMAYWHSLVDQSLYEKAKELNCDFSQANFDGFSKECEGIADKFEMGVSKVNIYDIFGTCWGLKPTDGSEHIVTEPNERGFAVVGGQLKTFKKVYTAADYTPWTFRPQSLNELPPCVYGEEMTRYLNRQDVRNSLHIPDFVQGWEMCKGDIDYTRGPYASQWIWESLKGQYRMLKFSGDTDGAVPTTGTYNWIQGLGREVLEAWRPYYTADNELGGYVEVYDGLTLGTVHGAGHMAPMFKPAATYHLIFNWLNERTI
jgi:serine carboxypeptidase-like clade 2